MEPWAESEELLHLASLEKKYSNHIWKLSLWFISRQCEREAEHRGNKKDHKNDLNVEDHT